MSTAPIFTAGHGVLLFCRSMKNVQADNGVGTKQQQKKKKSSLLEKEVLGVSCPCVHLVADDDRLPCPGSRGAPIS